MLYATYLFHELRHRLRQAVLIAAGLTVGVALVITVGALATGTSNAQSGVLKGLYGIGTDLSITRPYAHSDVGPGHQINAGEHIDFLDTNQGMFDSSAAATIASLPGVRSAAVALALQQTYQAGGRHVPGTPDPSATASGLPLSIPVDGVDPAGPQLGPLGQAKVIAGRGLTASDANADVALVDSGYAAAHHLQLGSLITLAGHHFRVVGIVSQPAGTVPDILIPLHIAEALSGFHGKVTTVYVAAAGTADLSALTAKIKAQWPWADVTTSASLAHEINGSLGETAHLARDLGRWLAVAVLAAAFALAALLTVTAVSRRVREFGTLKALGWSSGRITRQVLGESLTLGIAGALAGVGLGYAAAALVSHFARNLSASVAAAPGQTEPRGFVAGSNVKTGQHFYHPRAFTGTYNTLPVHFHAPVTLSVVTLAVGLGIAGGLLAGALGSWRAARLRPTDALARLG